MPHVRLGLSLRPMKASSGGYVRFAVWMSALCMVTLSPLVILAFIDPSEAMERLRVLGICVGIYVAGIGPTLYISIKRDPISARLLPELDTETGQLEDRRAAR